MNLGLDEKNKLKPFADISTASGFGYDDDSRSLGLVDWDFDGDLDVWVLNRSAPQLRFLRNNTSSSQKSLLLYLQGGAGSNRDAIGAVATVYLKNDQGIRVRRVNAGDGFLSQSSKWLHFGLGEAAEVDRVEVAWPGGMVASYEGIEAGRRYILKQGIEEARLWMPPANRQAPVAGSIISAPASDQARIVWPTRPPFPRVSYTRMDKVTSSLEIANEPTLVILWASWCPHCRGELASLKKYESELKKVGLKLFLLNIDEEKDGKSQQELASEALEELGLDFPGGLLSQDEAGVLDSFQRSLMSLQRPMPLPSSFLLDARGRAAVLYKGAPEFSQLLSDVENLDVNPLQYRDYAVPYPGRWIGRPEGPDAARVALKMLDDGFPQQGVRYLNEFMGNKAVKGVAGLNQRPNSQLNFTLGSLLHTRLQDIPAAIEAFEKALKEDPKYLKVSVELAKILIAEKSYKKAIDVLEKAQNHHGDETQLLELLSLAQLTSGKAREAIPTARKNVELNPSKADARFTLALALQAEGAHREAVKEYRIILKLSSGHRVARNNLAWLLATSSDDVLRNGDEALRLAAPLAQVQAPERGLFLRTIAAAEAELGRYEHALKAVAVALEYSKKNTPEIVPNLEQDIRSYRKQKSLRSETRSPLVE